MGTNRRQFLKKSAVAGSAVFAANLTKLANVHAQAGSAIRVGLVGCGGRGTGAATDCMHASPDVRLVAMGDAFQDRLTGALGRLNNDQQIRAKIDVAANRQFTGLDAYQRVIENCDLVILATPPGFRPRMIQAAVAARKNIFTEKPVAVDGPGIRTCYQAFEDANRARLCIVAGTQRRHQTGYIESMKKIHDGALGTITSARCYWNQGSLWHAPRTPGMPDLEWQCRNWLYFTAMSGDHIVEQHVHNLDVMNWALGNSHPLRAVGLGGRQVRTGPEFGHIFDHFTVDFEYPNGVRVMSMCRQIPGCENNVSEAVTGTRGTWISGGYRITGEQAWTFPRGQDNLPYRAEHVALINSIKNNQPINDLKNVTDSTLTAIMGRMACYSGRAITWEQALNSQQKLLPDQLSWNMTLPVPPVAMPGVTDVLSATTAQAPPARTTPPVAQTPTPAPTTRPASPTPAPTGVVQTQAQAPAQTQTQQQQDDTPRRIFGRLFRRR